MVTMLDVATQAGVSVSTVSHVLNETRVVSPDAAARVRVAARDLKYTHRPRRRAPSAQRSGIIGVAVSDIADSFNAHLVGQLKKQLLQEDHGFSFLLAETQDLADQELRVIRMFEKRRPDAIFLTPVGGAESTSLERLRRSKIPTVLLDRCVDKRFDQVGTANTEPVSSLVQHLADLGHSRIAFIHSLDRIATTHERKAGFELGMRRARLPIDRTLMRTGAAKPDRAATALEALMNLPTPPTAVVVGNGPMTLGAYQAAAKLKLRIPEDLALVAFDDFAWGEFVNPSLTTMAQPIESIAEKGIELLLNRMENPSSAPRTFQLQTTFEDRDSCGCSGLALVKEA